MASSSKMNAKTIIDLVEAYDAAKNKRYKKGKFLGKGGFAHCYELIDNETKVIYAGKIVPKSMLTKPHQKEKMTMEIDIHRSLSHTHVVGFHDFFEDKDHVYILLELCRRRSLMELHKRRKALTEPEVRYYLRQTLLAVKYLHDVKVIHRDLKLGNLFLNDNLEVKVGDFGLATRVEVEGERKRTLCGTPNYIAPEVLGKKGHSYEVDLWSLGCILYTLLVGKPPFETESLKDTYKKIKCNEYRIPSHVSPSARSLITRLLHSDPSCRPCPQDILTDPFMSGFLPARLPVSCLTTAPHFKNHPERAPAAAVGSRHPLSQVNSLPATTTCAPVKPVSGIPSVPQDSDEAEDPASMPVFWISKWVDYSDKYGLGYQLCDTSVGVLFNDSTRMLLGSDEMSLQYINRDSNEEFYTLSSYDDNLHKKVTLLKYFRSYMSEHLLKAGGSAGERPVEEGVRLPHLRAWFRTRSAIILHLSNGIMQINFFQDHTKVIICPLMSAVTYIDENKSFRTYRLQLISKYGCCKELCSRLRYAKTMAERLIGKLEASGAAAKSDQAPLASVAPVLPTPA